MSLNDSEVNCQKSMLITHFRKQNKIDVVVKTFVGNVVWKGYTGKISFNVVVDTRWLLMKSNRK